MTTISTTTQSHFLIMRDSDKETHNAWLTRYNTGVGGENIMLRNLMRENQEIAKEQSAQEIVELKKKHSAEVNALKLEMERLKDEAATTRISNIRLMRETATLREQFGYD